MASTQDNPTLLIRPGQQTPSLQGMPMIEVVTDPGPRFKRLRKFFRPWRFIGRAFLVTVPCWLIASLAALGGWVTGLIASITPALTGHADAGMNAATFFSWLPLGILALWASTLGLRDVLELSRLKKRSDAYRDALARAADADVLSPEDLRSAGIREGLRTLGHLEKLLGNLDTSRPPISALLRDSLYQSKRLVYRSVLDLIDTERRLAEWSARLGDSSTYKAKLVARRDELVGSYAGILDQCLHATDAALAGADHDPQDLQQSVDSLLASCQRALDSAERTGPDIDEQELLMFAAKAREQAGQDPAGPLESERLEEAEQQGGPAS